MSNQRGLVRRIERMLEDGVGDVFARVFGGSIVPEELEALLRREASDGVRTLAPDRMLAPNDYVITLGDSDFERLQADHDLTTRSFARHLHGYIHDQGWQTYGEVVVRLERSEGLHTGQFRARALVNPDATAVQNPPADPRPSGSAGLPGESNDACTAETGVPAMSDNPGYRGGQGQGRPGDEYHDEQYGRPQDEQQRAAHPAEQAYPPNYPPRQAYPDQGYGPGHGAPAGPPSQQGQNYAPPAPGYDQRPPAGYPQQPGYDQGYPPPPPNYGPPQGYPQGQQQYPPAPGGYPPPQPRYDEPRPAYPPQPGYDYGRPEYQQPVQPQQQYAEPHYEQGQYEQGQYGQPQYAEPQYGQPHYDQQYEQAPYGQPQYGQPQYEQAPYEQAQYEQQYGEPPYGAPGYPAAGHSVTLQLDDGSGRTYQLREGANVIGRGQDAQFRLPDTGVSRRHLEIRWDGQVALLSDLNSTNGTTVNNAPVQEWQLADGDVIRVGHSEIIVHVR